MPWGFEFSASFLLPQPDEAPTYPVFLSFEFSYFHPSCSSHGLTFPKHNFYQVIPFEKSIKAPQCLQCKKTYLVWKDSLIQPQVTNSPYSVPSTLVRLFPSSLFPRSSNVAPSRNIRSFVHNLSLPFQDSLLPWSWIKPTHTDSWLLTNRKDYKKAPVREPKFYLWFWHYPVWWLGTDFWGNTYSRLLFPHQYNEKLN